MRIKSLVFKRGGALVMALIMSFSIISAIAPSAEAREYGAPATVDITSDTGITASWFYYGINSGELSPEVSVYLAIRNEDGTPLTDMSGIYVDEDDLQRINQAIEEGNTGAFELGVAAKFNSWEIGVILKDNAGGIVDPENPENTTDYITADNFSYSVQNPEISADEAKALAGVWAVDSFAKVIPLEDVMVDADELAAINWAISANRNGEHDLTFITPDSVSVTIKVTLTEGSGGSAGRYRLTYVTEGGTQYKSESYSSGVSVKLDKMPMWSGYVFSGWCDDSERTQIITSITMNANKTVYAKWAIEEETTSVPEMMNGDKHFAYILGYPDGTVRPGGSISRAETATMFFRLLKDEVRGANLETAGFFEDVSESMWYNTPVSTMAALGIISGYPDETFRGSANITRAEFATICAKLSGGSYNGDGTFTDITGHWAEKSIELVASLVWITGYSDGSFKPNQYITRAEAVVMINRMLQRSPSTAANLHPDMRTFADNQDTETWYYLAIQEAANSHDFSRDEDGSEQWTAIIPNPDWDRYQ